MVKHKDIFAGARTAEEKIKRVLLSLRDGTTTTMAAQAQLQAIATNSYPGREIDWKDVKQMLDQIVNSVYEALPAPDLKRVCDVICGPVEETGDARE